MRKQNGGLSLISLGVLGGILDTISRVEVAMNLWEAVAPYWWHVFLVVGAYYFIRGRIETVVIQSCEILKREAREIKRRAPGSKFVQAPNDRAYWSHQPGVSVSVEEDLAMQWHDKFERYMAHIGLQRVYPRGDFDQVIASLDADELMARSIMPLFQMRGWRLLVTRSLV